jgi:hypothetical protein
MMQTAHVQVLAKKHHAALLLVIENFLPINKSSSVFLRREILLQASQELMLFVPHDVLLEKINTEFLSG